MFNVTIKYHSGQCDVKRCTEDDARAAVSDAYLRTEAPSLPVSRLGALSCPYYPPYAASIRSAASRSTGLIRCR
jgi:hypothetical protein